MQALSTRLAAAVTFDSAHAIRTKLTATAAGSEMFVNTSAQPHPVEEKIKRQKWRLSPIVVDRSVILYQLNRAVWSSRP